jgi:Dolichyl-phosphate-mannose-protein mannosyltransferase
MSIRLLQDLDQVGEALREFCERRKVLLLCVFSVAYLSATCLLASRKPMWNDELFTFYISRLPSVSDIWSALLTGGEQIPPFFHLITRISFSLFGVNELAIRLPQVLGFWVMSLCLFWFVSKRSSALYGFAAMLFPLVTKAYDYAYEARPYGMVLGFAGLLLLCWRSAVEGTWRKLSLIGIALSLAGAVSSHYYAVLLLFPLALGEATRSISLRRLDPPIWVTFGFGLTPLFLFLPLIQQAMKQSAIFWARPHWRSALEFYYSVLSPALLPLVAMLVLAGIYSMAQPISSSNRHRPARFTPPFHEIAAAAGFIAIPVVAFFLSVFFTGAMTARYVLSAVIGFSILFAFAAYTLLNGRGIVGAALVTFLCAGFISVEIQNFRKAAETSLGQAKAYKLLQSESENNLPIVASDLNTFTTLAHYAPRDFASRLVYLADPQASLRHLGHSSVDQGILDLKPWFRLKVEEYAPYIASHERFFVYGYADPHWVWLLSELSRPDFRVELKGRHKDNLLFLVTVKK